jgi:hypothetical protein
MASAERSKVQIEYQKLSVFELTWRLHSSVSDGLERARHCVWVVDEVHLIVDHAEWNRVFLAGCQTMEEQLSLALTIGVVAEIALRGHRQAE